MGGSASKVQINRKMLCAMRQASRQIDWPLPVAFFLTDPVRTPQPLAIVDVLPPRAGVIYRHFGASDRYQMAVALRRLTYAKGVSLQIGNDPELAMSVNADGVHWAEARAAEARKWKDRFAIQTQSAHSATAVRNAVCNLVLLSAVFPSNSPSASRPMGLGRYRAITRETTKVIYALGGVNEKTANTISGFGGFAAIEGFGRT